MHWVDIENYFDELVHRARENSPQSVGTEMDSMRFATMCIALGLDPREGKMRVLNAIGADDSED